MDRVRIFTKDQGETFVAPHFKAKEFFCKCGKCTNQLVSEMLASRLEVLREVCAGKSIHLNCGYRCEEHNKTLGSENTSQHCKGTAADIRIDGMTVEEVRNRAEFVGFKGIGIYDTFVHVDVREIHARWDERTKK